MYCTNSADNHGGSRLGSIHDLTPDIGSQIRGSGIRSCSEQPGEPLPDRGAGLGQQVLGHLDRGGYFKAQFPVGIVLKLSQVVDEAFAPHLADRLRFIIIIMSEIIVISIIYDSVISPKFGILNHIQNIGLGCCVLIGC